MGIETQNAPAESKAGHMCAWQCLHYVRGVVSEKSEVSPSSNEISSDRAASLTAAKLAGLEVRLLNGIARLVAGKSAGKQDGPGNLVVGRAHPEAIIVPYIMRPRQANPSDLQEAFRLMTSSNSTLFIEGHALQLVGSHSTGPCFRPVEEWILPAAERRARPASDEYPTACRRGFEDI